MVRLVRSHKSMHQVASQFRVSVSVVARWVERAAGHRLDKVDFSDRAPGCARGWNRVARSVERRIAELRKTLREQSVLGEYGATAIQTALQAEMRSPAPSITPSPRSGTICGSRAKRLSQISWPRHPASNAFIPVSSATCGRMDG